MDIGNEPSVRAQVITRRTYNRPLNEEGTIFETWEQTIGRVKEHQRWLWENAQGGSLIAKQEAELDELERLMLDRTISLSGRTLWLGGTEIVKRRQMSQFNPCRRSTKFITDHGVKSFEDYEDGDTVVVLTHKGNWKPARVVYAGMQPINEITFRRGRTVQTEYFTPSHTWVLPNDKRTNALTVGNLIHVPPACFYDWTFEDAKLDEKAWWTYGFTFGDGTLTNGGTGSMVRLCGLKGGFLPRFQELGFGFSFPPSCNKDPMVYMGSYTKTLPKIDDDIRLIRAFIHGYLAADGHKNHNSNADVNKYNSVQATSPETQQFIETFFPVVGLYILNKRAVTDVTNYGVRAHKTYIYSIHADINGVANMAGYRVTAIEECGEEEVWCLNVEDDHSFVLPNGVVTGNCSFLEIRTIHDVVDAFWALLQGCGVGFKPVNGSLSGFTRRMEVEIIRSTRSDKGRETNIETYDQQTRTWTIQIGDSAEAWSKSMGKIIAGKFPAKKLIIDLREIRPAGTRLAGYGWICSGDAALAVAVAAICAIMNKQASKLLSKIDIMEIINWLGTVLSSRRSSQITLMEYGDNEWYEFATAKAPKVLAKNWHRAQSNNSLMFWEQPTRKQLKDIFDMMIAHGGAEPGFVNASAAKERAPYFAGFNPCVEIALARYSTCNLSELDLAKWRNDHLGMHKALRLLARANYRQTMVNLRDGILQDAWHQTNEFLRLCGVGLTGIVRRPDLTSYDFRQLHYTAIAGAYSMADELGTERPKNVTTVKPSGTLSKAIFDTTEGAHRPAGRYIFNNVIFSRHDPLVSKLLDANYHIFDHPNDAQSVLIRLPVSYPDVKFDNVNGQEINRESAIGQLERYKMLQDNYVDHNTSITISYDPSELKPMLDWYLRNWDSYVATSFLFRADPTKTAEDLGFSYLPQEVVTKEDYEEYNSRLLPIDLDNQGTMDSPLVEDCIGGQCPTR